ncbi:MAG: glycoside-pentoside-hexuronide (GPH):cation symporter [Candidatus Izemoplasmataceae bacterium]|jgi:melibiose permease|uniref:glycoside-pentoside-hexuronide (GPH):cation symporter n=1 Tax=Liberiplasma polymorphum TaxID=3374570 RepID=UPI0037708A6F
METVSKRSKFIFAFGGLGKDAMFAMSTVMMFYFTALIGISPLFVGTMMMLVRVWDAVNDPIMGGIVSNTHTKMGKFRPWILIGSFLNAIILVFVFLNPNLGVDTLRMYIYITVMYTLWGMTYTLMDIPFWSMIPALTQSQKDRETITVLTRFFTSIGYFIIAAGYLNLASFLGGGSTPTAQINGLFYLSIIVSLVFFFSELLLVFTVKETVVPKNEQKTTLKRMFELLKENDQLLVVMIVILIANFVLFTTSGMAVYFIIYDIGNQDLYFVFIAIGGVLQVIGSLCFPLFKMKFKRKQIFNVSIILQMIGFIMLLANAFILNNIIILVFAIGALIFFGQGLQMVLQTVLLSDTVEYGEHKLGERSEAIAFSVQTFIVKLAMGLSLGVIGLGLEIFAFIPSIDDIHQPQRLITIYGMRILMFVLPVIGLLISLYIFNKKHILNEATYEKIVEELRERGNYDEDALEL